MKDRTQTKQITLGALALGGGAPVSVQTMCSTKTWDVEATVKQIRAMQAAGADIVRIAIPDMEAAKAVSAIKEQVGVPLVADIHFDYRLALEAAARGIDKIRINPGNIGGLLPGGVEAPTQYLRGETTGAEALQAYGIALGTDLTTATVAKKLKLAQKVGKLCNGIGNKLQAAVVEKIAPAKIKFPSTKGYFKTVKKEEELGLFRKKYNEQLGKAERKAESIVNLPDGRIRYYNPEIPARNAGEMRGASLVTELNPKNGNVRQWYETRDHNGKVRIVHPKSINGIKVDVPHYPNIQKDFKKFGGNE